VITLRGDGIPDNYEFMDEALMELIWNAKHISLKDPFGNELGINQILSVQPQT
jgi:hypothetical protein